MNYYRTPEHRKRRAELIRQWKPWEKSTGPKTEEGKSVVSMNAWKGGERAFLRELRRVLREQEQLQNEVAEVAGVLDRRLW